MSLWWWLEVGPRKSGTGAWIPEDRSPLGRVATTVGPMARSPSRHVASLLDAPAEHHSELGSLTRLTAETFPILERLSIKRLVLAAGTIREPHWHANANELTYCVAGNGTGQRHRAVIVHRGRGADVPRRVGGPAPHREHRDR